MEKVILDCDMGCLNDDALALSLLLQAEKNGDFKIAGITLEGGNYFINAEFETNGQLQTCSWDNTNLFLEKIGRSDISVYRGTDYPIGFSQKALPELTKYFENADYLPFNDGYGAIHAFEKTVRGSLCDSDDAANFMIDCVKENPGNVVIIAIGPTMNVANAIEQDSSFAKNVKAIYYMGGALGESYAAETINGKKVNAIAGANVTPYAEYNVLYDPTAFTTCITADFPQQYIAPAEMSVDFDREILDMLKSQGSDMADMWYKHYKKHPPQYPYWDPIAVFAYLRPTHATLTEEQYITVNTDRKDDRFGETTALDVDGYNALSENDKLKYGKITVINGVRNFWDETMKLFCLR